MSPALPLHPKRIAPAPELPSAFEDLFTGQRASLMRTVMESDLNAFAVVSGDVNPIHLDPAFSAQSRFGQRVAHGMFTASLISAVLGTRLPGPGAIYLSQSLQFLAPVRIGDVVEANVEVVELVEKRRRARFFCDCVVDGRPVMEGEAWLSVPSRPEIAALLVASGPRQPV